MANTDESTQASYLLMDQIRDSRLFTMPTTGDEMKLTQRNTNLCVAIAAMRLISFAFIIFLEKNIRPEKRSELKSLCESIIRFPKVPDEKKKNNESTNQTSGEFLSLLEEPIQIINLIQILIPTLIFVNQDQFNKLKKIKIRNRYFC